MMDLVNHVLCILEPKVLIYGPNNAFQMFVAQDKSYWRMEHARHVQISQDSKGVKAKDVEVTNAMCLN